MSSDIGLFFVSPVWSAGGFQSRRGIRDQVVFDVVAAAFAAGEPGSKHRPVVGQRRDRDPRVGTVSRNVASTNGPVARVGAVTDGAYRA
jgi:hypothetical protein